MEGLHLQSVIAGALLMLLVLVCVVAWCALAVGSKYDDLFGEDDHAERETVELAPETEALREMLAPPSGERRRRATDMRA